MNAITTTASTSRLWLVRAASFALFFVALWKPGVAQGCITSKDVFAIAQTGIGSNGFGTTWRGQDVELDEDTWVTRIQFSTGSASVNVDEIRLMTATPRAKTLVATKIIIKTNTTAEAILTPPYFCRAKQRYTIWFHQSGSPRGTSGCDLTKVNASWGAYHTDVDPTVAPGANEPGYYWGYQYGTNVKLIGGDNFETSGSLTPGGNFRFDVEVCPNDFGALFLSLGTVDAQVPGFNGFLRVDPATVLGLGITFRASATGAWTLSAPIPNDPMLRGLTLYCQILHDATFATTATFTVMDSFTIR
ncbi:MAG TPA: hypothetical protein PKE00_05545 [Planctomycetota bacterium]|nr:hypothetical protein [Planctomycetota bacterium]